MSKRSEPKVKGEQSIWHWMKQGKSKTSVSTLLLVSVRTPEGSMVLQKNLDYLFLYPFLPAEVESDSSGLHIFPPTFQTPIVLEELQGDFSSKVAQNEHDHIKGKSILHCDGKTHTLHFPLFFLTCTQK